MKRRKSHRTPSRVIRERVLRCRNHKTMDELREVAVGIHHNRIFTSRHCYTQQEVQMCFPILGMMDRRMVKRVARTFGKRGLIYEDFHKASPMGVNGLPMFFSCKVLTGGEHKIVQEFMRNLQKAEQEALA